MTLKTVVVAGCMLVVGFTLGALLVGNQAFVKKADGGGTADIGPLGRARRSVIQLLTDEEETQGGTIYTIWGRTQCPFGASLVYKGVIAGGYSTATGAGSEYLCLIEEPVWDKTVAGTGYSHVVGTEYKAGDGLFNMENVNGATIVNQNAVCAACRITKSTQVMIPGTNSCMAGWHREYYGYLMSTKDTGTAQKNYICVDIAPEAQVSGQEAEGGAELWPAEAFCGSYALPCPNYEHGKEITCVVCSK